MRKAHTCIPSSASNCKPGIHGGSHVISKLKPKIRVIHIYAPQVIQTDAANFRDLVQRLTGKPQHNHTPPTKHLMRKQQQEFLSLQDGKMIKNEDREEEEDDDETWRSNSNERFGGFFEGFSELDGFVEEISTMN